MYASLTPTFTGCLSKKHLKINFLSTRGQFPRRTVFDVCDVHRQVVVSKDNFAVGIQRGTKCEGSNGGLVLQQHLFPVHVEWIFWNKLSTFVLVSSAVLRDEHCVHRKWACKLEFKSREKTILETNSDHLAPPSVMTQAQSLENKFTRSCRDNFTTDRKSKSLSCLWF